MPRSRIDFISTGSVIRLAVGSGIGVTGALSAASSAAAYSTMALGLFTRIFSTKLDVAISAPRRFGTCFPCSISEYKPYCRRIYNNSKASLEGNACDGWGGVRCWRMIGTSIQGGEGYPGRIRALRMAATESLGASDGWHQASPAAGRPVSAAGARHPSAWAHQPSGSGMRATRARMTALGSRLAATGASVALTRPMPNWRRQRSHGRHQDGPKDTAPPWWRPATIVRLGSR